MTQIRDSALSFRKSTTHALANVTFGGERCVWCLTFSTLRGYCKRCTRSGMNYRWPKEYISYLVVADCPYGTRRKRSCRTILPSVPGY